jgi:hypothetical protein
MSAQQSKDWFARLLGVLGLLVAVIGLYLSWRNSAWQKHALEQNLEERLMNRVTMARAVKDRKTFDLSPIGELQIEIVNMGQRTVYLKDVSVRAGQDKNLYAGELVPNRDTPLTLEPGMNALYRVETWDFAKHPLWWEKVAGEPFWISITTTRWSYEQEGQIRGFVESLIPNKISAIPAMH